MKSGKVVVGRNSERMVGRTAILKDEELFELMKKHKVYSIEVYSGGRLQFEIYKRTYATHNGWREVVKEGWIELDKAHSVEEAKQKVKRLKKALEDGVKIHKYKIQTSEVWQVEL